MNRRELIKTGGLAALATAALPLSSASAAEQLRVTSQISNNHGHGVALSLSDVILLLRDAEMNDFAEVNIQGSSSHPHFLELTVDDLMDLLLVGNVVVTSTSDFGHSHNVGIQLS